MSKQPMTRYARVSEYFTMMTRQKHIPFTGTMELTPRCNMNCRMCYIRMTEEDMKNVGQELPAEEWIRLAQEAANEGMTMLLFTGGEALLYKDFKKVYLAVRKMGVFISINTNGTTLNDEWLEFFKQYPPAKFNITIYGGTNETYARLCRNPRGFDQLKTNIEKLQACGIHIQLNCMISKQNVEDMDHIFAFAEEHNLTVFGNTYAFPPVRKEGVADPMQDRFTPEEAARARVFLNWYAINDRQRFLNYCTRTSAKLEEAEMLTDNCATVEGDKIGCSAGRGNFWITWDGRLLTCGMIPDFSVPVRGRGFMDAWREIVAYAADIRLAPECANCPKKKLCMPCAAKLKAESGEYYQKSDYMCEYTDEYIRLLGEAAKYLESHAEENR